MARQRLQLFVTVDGLDPRYIEATTTPVLDRLAREGSYTIGSAVVPTVTNVNHVSIVCASLPAEHGITANYFLDPATGAEVYMESARYIERPTIFDRARQAGRRSLLLTSKDKVRTLLDSGADEAISLEQPPAWLVERVGPPPSVLSVEANLWLFRALRVALRELQPDVAYVATTDYTMHKFPPEAEEARYHLAELDRLLGEVVDDHAERLDLRLTADHGMNAKDRAVDLTRVLAEAGLQGRAVPIIKDRYVAHHANLGGSIYVFLAQPSRRDEAARALRAVPGVEAVLTREEAVDRFGLRGERIGDLFVLGDERTLFGDLDQTEEAVRLRSHGSLHEQRVPLLVWGPSAAEVVATSNYQLARDLVATLASSAGGDGQPSPREA